MDNELIVVKQLPVIEEQLRSVREKVQERVAFALSLVCDEDSYKTVKAERAALNKEFAEFEKRRKEVKKQILAPYEEKFEPTYKECISDIYRDADGKLKEKIDEVERGIKAQKQSSIEEYFSEYQASLGLGSDLVSFKRANIKIGMSDSLKSLKDKVRAFLDGVSNDLAVISTLEFKEEVFYEYKKTLRLSDSIIVVNERHEEMEAELKRREAAEETRVRNEEAIKETESILSEEEGKMEALSAPVSVPDPEGQEDAPPEGFVETRFWVKGSIQMLRALKEFLENGGYEYGSI